jgi:hypothetical protein
MSTESIFHIDETPTEDYPIRILRAYRNLCDGRWASSGEEENPVIILWNELSDKRAALLDKAIAVLEKELRKP